MKNFGLFCALVFVSMGTVSAYASTRCLPCRQSLEEVGQALLQVRQKLSMLEARPQAADWRVATVEPEKSIFLQRLEAQENYRASQARLEAIEGQLKKLEAEIEADVAGGRTGVDLDRLRRLAETQRLLVQELRFQLTQIQQKFQELDRRIDAHEERIDAIQGGLASVSSEFKEMAKEIRAHRVASAGSAYDAVREVERSHSGDLSLGDVWVFPRTEVRYEDTSYHKIELTTSAEGNLFGIVKGEAKGGLVFDTRLSSEGFALSPGTEPFLSPSGAAMRNAAFFCGISKTFTFRGFGAISGSAGIDVKVVKLSTGAALEVGESIAATSTRFSRLIQFRQGETFNSKLAECRKFAREIGDTETLDIEVSSLLRVVQVPETVCYKDYDCHRDVSLGMLLPSVVSQCFTAQHRQRSVCQHRLVDVVGSCSLPQEAITNFRYHCAKGFQCDAHSRRCKKETSDTKLLSDAGILEAKVVSLDVSYNDVGSPLGLSDGSDYCTTVGGLPEGKGWKLPAQSQLKSVGRWFREFARDNVRKRFPRAAAQSWFYPRQAFTGLLWSDASWVYLLSNDSSARYNPRDPQNAALFTDGQDRITNGIAICVRNR